MSLVSGPAWLFCPADRPERFAKAVAAADVVILDLEDAVSAGNKSAARLAIAAAVIDPAAMVIRVNDVSSDQFAADLELLRQLPSVTVMLPKVESPQDLDQLDGHDVIALVETPLGVLQLPDVAADPRVRGLMFGAEDLIAKLGGRGSRSSAGGYRPVVAHARSTLLIAGSAYGKLAIDAVFTDTANQDGLAAEAAESAGCGFDVKACIHPAQVPVVRAAFRPSEQDLAWARKVLASTGSSGVHTLDGRMIDRPIIEQAERVLRDAGELSPQ